MGEATRVLYPGANDYQDEAMATAGDLSWPESLLIAALGLNGEAGEVADLIKKWYGHGHDLDRDKLILELGDVLWYIAHAAHMMGVPLSEVMLRNRDKLRQRYPQGFDPERSKHREDVAPEVTGCAVTQKGARYVGQRHDMHAPGDVLGLPRGRASE